tara:strand:+ start:992 stop:1501 length:510 start_codon:yes stop_codon:yes gene_type:complete
MPTDETAPHSKTFFQRISHFLLIAAYLWLLLSVFTLHNAVTASDWTLATHLGEVTLKALLFGKFVLIAEHLHLGRRAEHLPLVWPILIKAALFAIVLIGFDVLEEHLLAAFRPAPAGAPAEAFTLSSPAQIASLTFMAFIALIPFFGINELGRVMGREKLQALFFKSRG